MRKIVLRISVAILALVAFGVVSPSANARLEDKVTIKVGQIIEKDYPPLIGQTGLRAGPVPFGLFPASPMVCGGTGQNENSIARPFCSLVPIEVTQPSDPNIDQLITITLSWNNPKVLGEGSNDLDLLIWSDPVGGGILAGSFGSEPEFVRLFRPSATKYQLVVSNFSGVNTGFHLQFKSTTERFVSPLAGIDPDFQPKFDSAPVDSDASPREVKVTQSGAVLEAAPAQVPVDELLTFRARSNFDESLGSGVPQSSAPLQGRVNLPVSGPLLTFWILLPVVAFVAGFIWLERRSRRALA